MQRYIVKFVEVRHYEMTVDAVDREAATRFAANGQDNPVWIKVELDRFEAQEIAAAAGCGRVLTTGLLASSR